MFSQSQLDELPDDVDKTILGFLMEYDSDSQFWRTRTPQERWTACEYLRWMQFGREACLAPMKKVVRIIDLSEDDSEG